MSYGYVRLIVTTNKYQARLNSKSKQIHIGYYATEDLAWEAIAEYKRKYYHKLVDYNRIAKDPIAWEKQAKSVLQKLSNLPNASKVEPSPFTTNELKEWL